MGRAPVFRAWRRGVVLAARDRQLVALLYAATALAAVVPGMLMFSLIESPTSSSAIGAGPMASLDFLHYSEIEVAAASAFMMLGRLEWAAAIVYLIVMLFAAGGLVERAASPQGPFEAGVFLAACCRRFRGIVALFGAAALAYAGVVYFHASLARLAAEATSLWESERAVVLVQLATHATALLALAVVALIFRYARIFLVLDAGTVGRSIRAGAAFVARQPVSTLTLQAVAVAAGLVVLAAFSLVQNVMRPASAGTIAGWAAVLQAAVLLRVGLRVAAVDAEVTLWRAFNTSHMASNLAVPVEPSNAARVNRDD